MQRRCRSWPDNYMSFASPRRRYVSVWRGSGSSNVNGTGPVARGIGSVNRAWSDGIVPAKTGPQKPALPTPTSPQEVLQLWRREHAPCTSPEQKNRLEIGQQALNRNMKERRLLELQKKQIDKLQAQLKACSEKCLATDLKLHEERRTFTHHIAELRKECIARKEDQECLKKSIEDLQCEHNTQTQKLLRINSDLDFSQSEMRRYKSINRDLERRLSSTQKHYSDASKEERYVRQKREIDALSRKVSESEKRVLELQRTMHAQDQQNRRASAMIRLKAAMMRRQKHSAGLAFAQWRLASFKLRAQDHLTTSNEALEKLQKKHVAAVEAAVLRVKGEVASSERENRRQSAARMVRFSLLRSQRNSMGSSFAHWRELIEKMRFHAEQVRMRSKLAALEGDRTKALDMYSHTLQENMVQAERKNRHKTAMLLVKAGLLRTIKQHLARAFNHWRGIAEKAKFHADQESFRSKLAALEDERVQNFRATRETLQENVAMAKQSERQSNTAKTTALRDDEADQDLYSAEQHANLKQPQPKSLSEAVELGKQHRRDRAKRLSIVLKRIERVHHNVALD